MHKSRGQTSCERKVQAARSTMKETKQALKAAAAALEGPPDRQDPNEALRLVKRALRRL